MKWRIGRVTVSKIVEVEVSGGSRFILPQATYEEILPIGWLRPHFADALALRAGRPTPYKPPVNHRLTSRHENVSSGKQPRWTPSSPRRRD